MFQDCESLETVNFQVGSHLQEISEETFYDTTNLGPTIDIPASVTKVLYVKIVVFQL